MMERLFLLRPVTSMMILLALLVLCTSARNTHHIDDEIKLASGSFDVTSKPSSVPYKFEESPFNAPNNFPSYSDIHDPPEFNFKPVDFNFKPEDFTFDPITLDPEIDNILHRNSDFPFGILRIMAKIVALVVAISAIVAVCKKRGSCCYKKRGESEQVPTEEQLNGQIIKDDVPLVTNVV